MENKEKQISKDGRGQYFTTLDQLLMAITGFKNLYKEDYEKYLKVNSPYTHFLLLEEGIETTIKEGYKLIK